MRPSGATTTPEPVPPRRAPVVDVEPHHRRADAVDHIDDGARIGVEQCLIVGGTGGAFANSDEIASDEMASKDILSSITDDLKTRPPRPGRRAYMG